MPVSEPFLPISITLFVEVVQQNNITLNICVHTTILQSVSTEWQLPDSEGSPNFISAEGLAQSILPSWWNWGNWLPSWETQQTRVCSSERGAFEQCSRARAGLLRTGPYWMPPNTHMTTSCPLSSWEGGIENPQSRWRKICPGSLLILTEAGQVWDVSRHSPSVKYFLLEYFTFLLVLKDPPLFCILVSVKHLCWKTIPTLK